MRETDRIGFPLSFEHMLGRLFGEKFSCGFSSYSKKIASWKKVQIKLLKSVKKAVLVNVDTDEYHMKDILMICDSGLKKISQCKSIDQINVNMIESYTKIIFRLLGNMPNNSRKKNVSHRSIWKLNKFRKLTYTQTVDQKVNLILRIAKQRGSKGDPSFSELWDKLYIEFKSDKIRFLDWYKKNFKDKYIDLT